MFASSAWKMSFYEDFLDTSYIIYLKYSESDEVFKYCIDLLKNSKNSK